MYLQDTLIKVFTKVQPYKKKKKKKKISQVYWLLFKLELTLAYPTLIPFQNTNHGVLFKFLSVSSSEAQASRIFFFFFLSLDFMNCGTV